MIRWFKKTKGQVAKAITPLLAPYIVLVNMDGVVIKHYAWSMDDALEWAACYDACDNVSIHNLYTIGFKDSFVAGRQQS